MDLFQIIFISITTFSIFILKHPNNQLKSMRSLLLGIVVRYAIVVPFEFSNIEDMNIRGAALKANSFLHYTDMCDTEREEL